MKEEVGKKINGFRKMFWNQRFLVETEFSATNIFDLDCTLYHKV